jgi:hypothetical protein
MNRLPLLEVGVLGSVNTEYYAARTGTDLGQVMRAKPRNDSKPSWPDPRNGRKTPFTDAERDALAKDFVATMGDTQAWRVLVGDTGEP